MASTIKIKNSSTAGAIPTSSDLVQGELAVNVTDKTIFTENASGEVVELGKNYTGFKNRIINGAMMIDQRNAGAQITPVDEGFPVDRFIYNCSQASKFTAQQTPSATETGYATRIAAGFNNYLALTVASAVSIGATDYFTIGQRIEGYNVADLQWGTPSAKSVTLSFLVYSSLTGTFGASLTNGTLARGYPFTYSIPTANTWTQISVTIPGDTSGTWLKTNGNGLRVYFGMGVGSTYSAAAGSWYGTGNIFGATGATSVVGTSGATFYITGVQLEKGSTATSFDYRPYGTELALCQRYFTALTGSGYAYTAYVYVNIPFPVEMRASPTVTPTVSPSGGSPAVNTQGWFAINNATTSFTYTATAEL